MGACLQANSALANTSSPASKRLPRKNLRKLGGGILKTGSPPIYAFISRDPLPECRPAQLRQADTNCGTAVDSIPSFLGRVAGGGIAVAEYRFTTEGVAFSKKSGLFPEAWYAPLRSLFGTGSLNERGKQWRHWVDLHFYEAGHAFFVDRADRCEGIHGIGFKLIRIYS